MTDRLLADGYLDDVTTKAGGPFADVAAAVLAVGARVLVVALPSGVRALASETHIYIEEASATPIGLAQLLLLRAHVGHRDADVLALAGALIAGRKRDSKISTRFL